jgi:hypothetical protein
MGYQLIETITVGSGGAASIEFVGIPQDAQDLQVVLSGRSNNTATLNLWTRFNSDTGSNYSVKILRGNGASVNSYSYTEAQMRSAWVGESDQDGFSSVGIYVSNYTSATNKSVSIDGVQETNATTAQMDIVAGSYSTTSPITTITFLMPISANFVQYSTASLYKITAD